MKRIVMSVLAVLLVLSAGAPTAYAASHEHRQSRTQSCISANTQIDSCTDVCKYLDADGDGICDNCDNHCSGCGNMCDKNSDGICDNCGTRAHFTDEDGDGICDLRETCQNTAGNKHCVNTGRRSGHHSAGH